MVSVAAMAGLEVSSRRWAKVEELFSHNNPRLLVDYTCCKMIPDAGWFGFGPGTFRIAFPYYTHELKDAVSGIWRYAHQDYLQTFIEWGRIGAFLWAAWLLGGLFNSARALRRAGDQFSFRERALHLGMATAVAGALLHAMVDFPLQIASIQLYLGVLLAFMWSQPAWRKESAGQEANPTSRIHDRDISLRVA
jgi:O-antigen ligase